MVARIKSGKSLIGLLNYNERKVHIGKAKLLHTSGYLKNDKDLNFADKLCRLTGLAERNHRTVTNALHISLNFDPQEKHSKETLSTIADTYMKGIGFGGQPYLVYEHFDAGHPHIHIVSTNIRKDGTRISLHNIGKDKSEPVRKAIEKAYGLIKAEEQEKAEKAYKLSTFKPVVYGSTETKKAVSHIVTEVFKHYRFGSFNEYNTVLEQYNIQADRGGLKTTMFRQGGLRYWVLDGQHKRVGVPIKASAIYSKPTLAGLEKRFPLNIYMRKAGMRKLRQQVDDSLSNAMGVQDLVQILYSKGIALHIHRNASGLPYGATFIDHNQKLVAKASELGKAYGIQQLLKNTKGGSSTLPLNETYHSQQVSHYPRHPEENIQPTHHSLLQALMETEKQPDQQAGIFKKKKKRKKKLTP